jgi:hypothetical protein
LRVKGGGGGGKISNFKFKEKIDYCDIEGVEMTFATKKTQGR